MGIEITHIDAATGIEVTISDASGSMEMTAHKGGKFASPPPGMAKLMPERREGDPPEGEALAVAAALEVEAGV